MSSWYEKEVDAGEPRFDFSRWLWLGVFAVIALTLGGIMLFSQSDAVVSQVQVRHILIPFGSTDAAERQRAIDLAQTVRQRVLDGESFDSLARQYSGDPGTASRGGYLGWSKKGVYSETFEEYIWNGEVGTISDIVPSSYGFHIIEILDRKISPADAYDMEIDRKAWEMHRQEEKARAEQAAPPEAAGEAPAEAGEPTPAE